MIQQNDRIHSFLPNGYENELMRHQRLYEEKIQLKTDILKREFLMIDKNQKIKEDIIFQDSEFKLKEELNKQKAKRILLQQQLEKDQLVLYSRQDQSLGLKFSFQKEKCQLKNGIHHSKSNPSLLPNNKKLNKQQNLNQKQDSDTVTIKKDLLCYHPNSLHMAQLQKCECRLKHLQSKLQQVEEAINTQQMISQTNLSQIKQLQRRKNQGKIKINETQEMLQAAAKRFHDATMTAMTFIATGRETADKLNLHQIEREYGCISDIEKQFFDSQLDNAHVYNKKLQSEQRFVATCLICQDTLDEKNKKLLEHIACLDEQKANLRQQKDDDVYVTNYVQLLTELKRIFLDGNPEVTLLSELYSRQNQMPNLQIQSSANGAQSATFKKYTRYNAEQIKFFSPLLKKHSQQSSEISLNSKVSQQQLSKFNKQLKISIFDKNLNPIESILCYYYCYLQILYFNFQFQQANQVVTVQQNQNSSIVLNDLENEEEKVLLSPNLKQHQHRQTSQLRNIIINNFQMKQVKSVNRRQLVRQINKFYENCQLSILVEKLLAKWNLMMEQQNQMRRQFDNMNSNKNRLQKEDACLDEVLSSYINNNVASQSIQYDEECAKLQSCQNLNPFNVVIDTTFLTESNAVNQISAIQSKQELERKKCSKQQQFLIYLHTCICMQTMKFIRIILVLSQNTQIPKSLSELAKDSSQLFGKIIQRSQMFNNLDSFRKKQQINQNKQSKDAQLIYGSLSINPMSSEEQKQQIMEGILYDNDKQQIKPNSAQIFDNFDKVSQVQTQSSSKFSINSDKVLLQKILQDEKIMECFASHFKGVSQFQVIEFIRQMGELAIFISVQSIVQLSKEIQQIKGKQKNLSNYLGQMHRILFTSCQIEITQKFEIMSKLIKLVNQEISQLREWFKYRNPDFINNYGKRRQCIVKSSYVKSIERSMADRQQQILDFHDFKKAANKQKFVSEDNVYRKLMNVQTKNEMIQKKEQKQKMNVLSVENKDENKGSSAIRSFINAQTVNFRESDTKLKYNLIHQMKLKAKEKEQAKQKELDRLTNYAGNNEKEYLQNLIQKVHQINHNQISNDASQQQLYADQMQSDNAAQMDEKVFDNHLMPTKTLTALKIQEYSQEKNILARLQLMQNINKSTLKNKDMIQEIRQEKMNKMSSLLDTQSKPMQHNYLHPAKIWRDRRQHSLEFLINIKESQLQVKALHNDTNNQNLHVKQRSVSSRQLTSSQIQNQNQQKNLHYQSKQSNTDQGNNRIMRIYNSQSITTQKFINLHQQPYLTYSNKKLQMIKRGLMESCQNLLKCSTAREINTSSNKTYNSKQNMGI